MVSFNFLFSEHQFVERKMWAGWVWKATSSSGVQSTPNPAYPCLKALSCKWTFSTECCCPVGLSGLLMCETVLVKQICFWLQHLLLADIYKFTTFMATRNYLCAQGERWGMCASWTGVQHHFNGRQQEDRGFSTNTSLHYKALLIHPSKSMSKMLLLCIIPTQFLWD